MHEYIPPLAIYVVFAMVLVVDGSLNIVVVDLISVKINFSSLKTTFSYSFIHMELAALYLTNGCWGTVDAWICLI